MSGGGSGGSTNTIERQDADPWAGIQPYLLGTNNISLGGGGVVGGSTGGASASDDRLFGPDGREIVNTNIPGGNVLYADGSTGPRPEGVSIGFTAGSSSPTDFLSTDSGVNGLVSVGGTDVGINLPSAPGILPEAARLYQEGPDQFYPGQTYADFSNETDTALAAMSGRLDNNLYGVAGDELTKTIQGDYLGGDQFMSAYGNDIMDNVTSRFGTSGRTGSNYHVDTATQELGNTAARLYDSERNRQLTGASLVPAYEQGVAGVNNQALQAGLARDQQAQRGIDERISRYDFNQNADWENFNRYAGIVNQVQHGVPASVTSESSTPYYTNTIGNAVGGGLLGYQAGNMIGGAMGGANFGPYGALIGAGLSLL